MTDRHDLDRALDALTTHERSAVASAAAEARDRNVDEGHARLAALWHAVADSAAAARDRERESFRAWQLEVDARVVTSPED